MNLLSSLFGPSLPSLNAIELSEKLKDGKQVGRTHLTSGQV
jgi:hypothetical protein